MRGKAVANLCLSRKMQAGKDAGKRAGKPAAPHYSSINTI
jgi:hypothetical protein